MKEFLKLAVLGTLIILLIEFVLLTNDIRLLIRDDIRSVLNVKESRENIKHILIGMENTINELNASALLLRGSITNIDLTLGRIEDASKSWKSVADKEGKYWDQLQNATLRTIENVNIFMNSASALLQNTDASLNAKEIGVLQELASVVHKSGPLANQLAILVQTTAHDIDLTDQDIHAILSDPSIKEDLKQMLEILKHGNVTASHVENSTALIEKYLSPKRATFWMRVLSLFIPKLSIDLRN